MTKLHALLVGINEYEHIHPLTACESDVDRMEGLLKRFWSDLLDEKAIRTLKGRAATRKAIIGHFKAHLCSSAVGPGDLVFFYFSGHGAQEDAAPYFRAIESKSTLENIACYDSHLDSGAGFIADKELRYLIQLAANRGAEVVTVFDCCHSGNNTRSVAGKDIIEKLGPRVPVRPWSAFEFVHDLGLPEPASDAGEVLEEWLPEGRHVQLAACQSHQSAIELRHEGGVFTKGLIQLIEDYGGRINYYDLHTHLHRYTRSMFDQNPQLYLFAGKVTDRQQAETFEQMLYRDFLSDRVEKRPVRSQIYFDRKENVWMLNAGAVYGVRETWEGEPQRFPIMLDNEVLGYARAKEVRAGETVLELEPYADVIKRETYVTQVASLLGIPLKVEVAVGGPAGGLLRDRLQQTEGLIPVSDGEPADFTVGEAGADWMITLPGTTQPLSRQWRGSTEEKVDATVDQLKVVHRWWFARHLPDPQLALPANCVRLEYHDDEGPVSILEEAFTFPIDRRRPAVKGRFRLVNTTDTPLYTSLIYLSSLFEVGAWTPGRVMRLEPNHDWSLKMDHIAPEPYVIDFARPHETTYLLVIASTRPFGVDLLVQPGLQAPDRKTRAKDTLDRGMKPASAKPLEGWYSFLVECRIPNPNTSSED